MVNLLKFKPNLKGGEMAETAFLYKQYTENAKTPPFKKGGKLT